MAVYREVHSGADLFDRPRLSALREAVRRREVDAVVAFALDRLTRNQAHLGLILSEVDHAGAEIELVTERLEDTPEGRLLQSVRGFVAEVERLKIAERTQRGKRARIESGKYNVGCRAPFGYRWEDATTKARLVEDPATAPMVRRIFHDIAAGVSARQMSLCFTAEGVPTPTGRGATWYWSTILKIVWNSLY